MVGGGERVHLEQYCISGFPDNMGGGGTGDLRRSPIALDPTTLAALMQHAPPPARAHPGTRS